MKRFLFCLQSALWLALPGLVPAEAAPPQPAWLAPPAAVSECQPTQTRLEQNGAVLEQLGPIFVDGAGEMVTARAGDWRLSNKHLAFTFAAVDNTQTTGSFPVAGWRNPEFRKNDRLPGALIDVALAGQPLDTLGSFTQGAGLDIDGPTIQYDTAQAVKRAGMVGLRLEGSPFTNAPVRIETTYWLAADWNYLLIESRLLNLPAGIQPAAFCDVANWGEAFPFVPRKGYLGSSKPQNMVAEGLYASGGDASALLTTNDGTLLPGNLQGRPAITRTLWQGAALSSAPTTASLIQDKVSTAAMATVREQRWVEQRGAAMQPPPDGIWKRRLYWAAGPNHAVRALAQADLGIPTGTISGQVKDDHNNLLPHAQLQVLTNIPAGHEKPELICVGESDDEGNYQFHLPAGRYFVLPVTRYNTNPYQMITSVDVVAGATVEKVSIRRTPARVHVRVVDDETSKPLEARLTLQRVGGTYVLMTDSPASAQAYYSQAWCGPEGTTLDVPAGRNLIGAIRGIEYSFEDREIDLKEGQSGDLTIRLRRLSPIEGWTQLLPGLRTSATPGVMISAEDIVRLSAASGLQWVTSGDFDTITDLAPTVKKLKLEGRLRTSRGFRTAAPRHPEWGQFLIYPVSATAPDPATARKAWAKADTRHALLSALRKHYPGALIQSEEPWLAGGDGFIGFGEKSAFTAGGKPYLGEDLGLDAVNLFHSNRTWDSLANNYFYFSNQLLKRPYLYATAHDGRTLADATPGYPRLLIKNSGTQSPTEKALFAAYQAGHYQLSSGPFIDFTVAGKGPGDVIPLDTTLPVKLRITAPNWAVINTFSIDKDGESQMKQILTPDIETGRVIPIEETPRYDEFTMKELRPYKGKDTLLNATVRSGNSITERILRGGRPGPNLPATAFTGHMVIDRDNNQRFDPPNFMDRGR
jgi:hypothetical protein